MTFPIRFAEPPKPDHQPHSLAAADLPDLCKIGQVANYLGISIPTLNRWAAEDKGPARVKLGSAVRYPKDMLLAWVADQQVSA